MSNQPKIPKILVVDDEPDVELLIRRAFRRKVRDGELSIVFALNGVEALARLREEPDIDMVLSDINMPQMDGLTLLDQLAKVDPSIKAVIVSAYGDMRNIRTAMNLGAFDFVTKPIDLGDLEITVDKTLKHLALMREALRSRDQLVALHQELDLARQLQRSILPRRFPQSPAYELYADMCPAKEVGGDFYDFFEVGPGRVAVAIGDVSGKGMAAALFMAVARTLLRASALAGLAPGACLQRVNELLSDGNDASMFVSLFYGVLDLASGELVYANGGHSPPYRIASDGQVTGLAPTGGMALGVMPGSAYAEKAVALGPGEGLFLYTDGVTEALDRQSNEFGDARLVDALRQSGGSGARAILERVTAAAGRFVGDAAQSDDMTCLALRYGGAGTAQQTAADADAPAANPTPTTGDANRRLSVTLSNRPDEIRRLAALLEGFGEANGLSPKLIFNLNLSFDELLTNIISYGYDDDAAHEIEVNVTLADDLLTATLEEEAKPFDPLSAPQPDLDATLEERPVGGLGIHIVKTLMDDVAYERRQGRNRLVMRKAI
jgi:sigma-B regulation protein RsbU (phosphoserine phosphatase)